MIYLILCLMAYIFIGINKLTCYEISRLESGNYLTNKEAALYILSWPWR